MTADEGLPVLRTGHGAEITGHRPLIAERSGFTTRGPLRCTMCSRRARAARASSSTSLWPEVGVNQTFLTLCEVLGALDVLEAEGRVTSAQRDGVLVYERL